MYCVICKNKNNFCFTLVKWSHFKFIAKIMAYFARKEYDRVEIRRSCDPVPEEI